LLLRELDARLHAVESTVRELAGATELAPPPTGMSLDALATAGMSRPVALLKTASLTNVRARQRHDTLATPITLVDRLVTRAGGADLLRPVHRLRLSGDLYLRDHVLRRVAVDHRIQQPEGTASLRGRGGRRRDGLVRARVCVPEHRRSRRVLARLCDRHRSG